VIRRLDPAADHDLAEALAALQRAAYRVEAVLVGSDEIPALRETGADLAGSGETFLGDPDWGFVAYVRDGGALDVHRLVVHPLHHRRGLATRLLDALDVAERGIDRTTVSTAAANAPALALYARRGFVRKRTWTTPGGLKLLQLERVGPTVAC
jgi:ribosomal protein S18 acetylase RimI-like enzyme